MSRSAGRARFRTGREDTAASAAGARGAPPRPSWTVRSIPASPAGVELDRLGAGRPLDARAQRDFGDRFHFDFGAVRIHSDAEAAAVANSHAASAMTFGRHIAFAAGEFSTTSAAGRSLLAHELAHVVQQTRGVVGSGPSAAALEGDAAQASASALAGDRGAAVRLNGPIAPAFRDRRSSAPANRSGAGVVGRTTTEARVQSEVARLRPEIPMAINIFGMETFDSNFYGDDQLFDFRGRVMRGWEVNYYFIAMAMAHQGYSWEGAQDMIWAWNTAQYVLPGDPLMTDEMWFAARQGFDDEIARLPPREPRHSFESPMFACFPGDVGVLLADGTEVPIHRIALGARVVAVDEDTGRVVACEVVARFAHPPGRVRVYRLANGRSLRVTPNHRLRRAGTWVEAGDLRAGDVVTTLTPQRDDLVGLQIESIEAAEPIAETLYDITVAGCHNFFAAGVLVHNKLP